MKMKDKKEVNKNKVIGKSGYMNFQTAELMRVTLVPRKYGETTTFALLGFNVLIRQDIIGGS